MQSCELEINGRVIKFMGVIWVLLKFFFIFLLRENVQENVMKVKTVCKKIIKAFKKNLFKI